MVMENHMTKSQKWAEPEPSSFLCVYITVLQAMSEDCDIIHYNKVTIQYNIDQSTTNMKYCLCQNSN